MLGRARTCLPRLRTGIQDSEPVFYFIFLIVGVFRTFNLSSLICKITNGWSTLISKLYCNEQMPPITVCQKEAEEKN